MGSHHGCFKRFRRGVCPPLCRARHSLVLVARRLERLQAVAEALRRQHQIDVVMEQVDLSTVDEVIKLHPRLHERDIAIDILINNAGHGLHGPFLDVPLDSLLVMVQLDTSPKD
jgi:uncharacterized protein